MCLVQRAMHCGWHTADSPLQLVWQPTMFILQQGYGLYGRSRLQLHSLLLPHSTSMYITSPGPAFLVTNGVLYPNGMPFRTHDRILIPGPTMKV